MNRKRDETILLVHIYNCTDYSEHNGVGVQTN